jgi:hypothetical protein
MKRVLLVAALVTGSSRAFAGGGDVDLIPFGYVSQVMQETRANVRQRALASAPKSGDGFEAVRGEAGHKYVGAVSSKSRTQGARETREAARLGVLHHTEAGASPTSAEQEPRISEAGTHALHSGAATK